MHLDKTITNRDGRAARLSQARPDVAITVDFGDLDTVRTDPQVLANNPAAPVTRVEFRVSPSHPSRTYKSIAAAERAAAKWINA